MVLMRLRQLFPWVVEEVCMEVCYKCYSFSDLLKDPTITLLPKLL